MMPDFHVGLSVKKLKISIQGIICDVILVAPLVWRRVKKFQWLLNDNGF